MKKEKPERKKPKKAIEDSGISYEIRQRPRIVEGKYVGDEDYVYKTVKIPTIEGLAYSLGVHKDTVYQWEKEYSSFSDVTSELRAKQGDLLLKHGLSGEYNPVITKLMLDKHGYNERQELTGAEGVPLVPKTLTDEEKEKLLSLLGKK